MSILFAQNSFLKIAEESTWGTGVTTSVFVKLISSTLGVVQERERRTHLSVPTSGMLSGTFEGFRNAGGTVEIPAYYDGIGLFIKAALGSVATTGSSPLFTHTYTPAEDQPSLTVDFQRGSNLANSMEKFTGVKISTMTISAEAGSEMTCSFDVLAKDGATRTSNITFTAPTFDQVYHYEAGDLSLGGTLSISTLAIRSFELTLDNKLDRRNLLGSKLTGDVTDNSLYNDSLDGNSGEVSIEFTRAAETTHRFKIILDSATIEDYNDNITAFGRVERTFTVRGYASGSDAGLTIEIKNASSSGA
jgi:hypothetical protein